VDEVCVCVAGQHTLQAAFIAEMKRYGTMAIMFRVYDCVFISRILKWKFMIWRPLTLKSRLLLQKSISVTVSEYRMSLGGVLNIVGQLYQQQL
jgi:hypothetical protein